MPALIPISPTTPTIHAEKHPGAFVVPEPEYQFTLSDEISREPTSLEKVNEIQEDLDQIRCFAKFSPQEPLYIVGSFVPAAIRNTTQNHDADIDLVLPNRTFDDISELEIKLAEIGYEIMTSSYRSSRDPNRIGLKVRKGDKIFEIASVKIQNDNDLSEYLKTLLSTIFAIEYADNWQAIISNYRISDESITAYREDIGYLLPFINEHFDSPNWPAQVIRFCRELVSDEQSRTDIANLRNVCEFIDHFDISRLPQSEIDRLSPLLEWWLKTEFNKIERAGSQERSSKFFQALNMTGIFRALYPISWAVSNTGDKTSITKEIGPNPIFTYTSKPYSYARFKEALFNTCDQNGLHADPDIGHTIGENYDMLNRCLDTKITVPLRDNHKAEFTIRQITHGIRIEPSNKDFATEPLADSPELVEAQTLFKWILQTFYPANSTISIIIAQKQGQLSSLPDDLRAMYSISTNQLTHDIVFGELEMVINQLSRLYNYTGTNKVALAIRQDIQTARNHFELMLRCAYNNRIDFGTFINWILLHEDTYNHSFESYMESRKEL